MQTMNEKEVVQKDILSLALVGDAVWSLFVRDKLIRKFDCKSGELSKKTINFVSAQAQSRLLGVIEKELTEDEKEVMIRARNCNCGTKAKNASVIDYRRATALEAVFGFLHLMRQTERLNKIMEICYNS